MKIAFIGGGNMAAALIGGLVARGVASSSFVVVEPAALQRETLRERFGVVAIESADLDALQGSALCVLAVKPQQMRAAIEGLGAALSQALVVSIAAGIRSGDVSRWLDGHRRIVRAMPNTPALIGRGVTGLFAVSGLAEVDRDLAARTLTAVGEVVWVDAESALDAVTAVSGSGPAYVFLMMEAMQQAACTLGLDERQARVLVLNTFAGAAELALRSDEPIALLRERVTSKGGTTAAALDVFEASPLRAIFVDALCAAQRRGAQLGEEFGK
ncbi:MAG: pyrroline-5-carboxylate reductase [Burkholderiaceae bacterium]|nr:pyrroline-5-carboxylate reductase [Burkholderiaceae bacterium]